MPTPRNTGAKLPPEQTALLAGHEPLLGDASPGRWTDAGVAPEGREEASRRRTAEGGGALDGTNHEVGFARGVAIGISLFVLIFIH
ncbi:hypothetical protein TsFJ059_001240, partial [Trichoderma semiorbis]